MFDTAPYRLHRSFTFWAGVALLLCFSLAWWYSWRDVLALRHGSLTVMHASGGLTITRNPAEEKPLEFFQTAPSAAVQDIRRPLFPKPYSIAGQELAASGIRLQPQTLEQWHRSWIAAYPRSFSLVFVPDWLMAGALLLSWAVVVGWRIHRGAEAAPVAWPQEGQRAAAPQIVARPSPPTVPRRTTFEAGTCKVKWADVVPRRVAIPGSPWAYSGVQPLTDTPMPFHREG